MSELGPEWGPSILPFTWRRIAIQVALDSRYLDDVIYGRVESSLDILVWIVFCVSMAIREERVERNRGKPGFFEPSYVWQPYLGG